MIFNETWLEAIARSQPPNLCSLGLSENNDGRPNIWLANTFSTSPLKPLIGIQWNFTGNMISTSASKLEFLDRAGNKDGHPGQPINKGGTLYSDGNSRWLSDLWLAETLSNYLKPLYAIKRSLTGSNIAKSWVKLVFIGPVDRKSKVADLASDCLGHFRLLLWNHWT